MITKEDLLCSINTWLGLIIVLVNFCDGMTIYTDSMGRDGGAQFKVHVDIRVYSVAVTITTVCGITSGKSVPRDQD
jgi:hypothetical protein